MIEFDPLTFRRSKVTYVSYPKPNGVDEMAKWTKESIQTLLDTNDKAVCRAVVRIYERQTQYEQDAHTTTDANGVGFSAFDAEFLTSLAVSVIKYGKLTDKQLPYARKRIRRYWKQLAAIANDNEMKKASASFPTMPPLKAKDHPDVVMGNAFAAWEAEQEKKAFLSDPDYQRH